MKYWIDELTQYALPPIPKRYPVVFYDKFGAEISDPSDSPKYWQIFESMGVNVFSLEFCGFLAMEKLNRSIDALADEIVSQNWAKQRRVFDIINGEEGSLTRKMVMKEFRTSTRTGNLIIGDELPDFFDMMLKP